MLGLLFGSGLSLIFAFASGIVSDLPSLSPLYIVRTLCESISSSADKALVGIDIGASISVLGFLRLPTGRDIEAGFPSALFIFLPPKSMLPLLENSIWPGFVKSSRLELGISVVIPKNGIRGTGGVSCCLDRTRSFGPLHLLVLVGVIGL